MKEYFIEGILTFVVGTFVGVVLGSGINHWYMSSESVRQTFLLEEKQRCKAGIKSKVEPLLESVKESLNEQQKEGKMTKFSFERAARLYLSPWRKVIVHEEEKYVIFFFGREVFYLSVEEYKTLVSNLETILKYKPELFKNFKLHRIERDEWLDTCMENILDDF